jgi:hypothetical protein
MKWIILVITVLLLPTIQAKETFYKVIAKPSLNVRSSSSMQSKILGKVTYADIVAVNNIAANSTTTVAGKIGKWVNIRYLADKKEYSGFVFDAFLEKSTQTQLLHNTANTIQKDDCTFEANIFNKQWINENPVLKQKPYMWDAKKRQFGILLAPDRILNISGGGCHDMGEVHVLSIINAADIARNHDWYLKNLKKLAYYLLQSEQIQGSKLASTLNKQIDALSISAKEIEDGKPFDVSASPYYSYGLGIRDYGTVVEFQIDWYIN